MRIYCPIPSVRNSAHSVNICEVNKWVLSSPSEYRTVRVKGIASRQVNTNFPFVQAEHTLYSQCFSTCHHWAAPSDHRTTEEGGGLRPALCKCSPLRLDTCWPWVLLKRDSSLVMDSSILTKLGRKRMTWTSWLARCLPQLIP